MPSSRHRHRQLVDGFNYYVNDAFGSCHRSHASVVGPPRYLPNAAGRLLVEVEALTQVLFDPDRPFVAIVGGVKVADKLGVLKALAQRADLVLLGGAMCFTFLEAAGRRVGASHVELDLVEEATMLLGAGPGIELPTDIVALSPDGTLGIDLAGTGEVRLFEGDLPDGWQGVDVGPATRSKFAKHDRRRRHGVVERPRRSVRGPALRRGYRGRRRGRRRLCLIQRRRRG